MLIHLIMGSISSVEYYWVSSNTYSCYGIKTSSTIFLPTCLLMLMGSCGEPCGESVTRGELNARDRGRAMWLPDRGVKAESVQRKVRECISLTIK